MRARRTRSTASALDAPSESAAISEPATKTKASTKRKPNSRSNDEPSKKPRLSHEPVVSQQPAQALGRLVEPLAPQLPFRLSAPPPTRERKTREFEFRDSDLAKQISFRPNVSPEEMLRQGVFGGRYFRPYYSKKLDREYHEDWLDMPAEWYEGLDMDTHLTSEDYNINTNRWKAKVGQSIEDWEAAGWIDHQHDVRGWFQWYARFFQGRRCADDERQMRRWAGVAGPRGRWRTIYLGKYVNSRVNVIQDDAETISPGIRQTLLHWAFEVTTTHLNLYKLDKGIKIINDGDSQDEASD